MKRLKLKRVLRHSALKQMLTNGDHEVNWILLVNTLHRITSLPHHVMIYETLSSRFEKL